MSATVEVGRHSQLSSASVSIGRYTTAVVSCFMPRDGMLSGNEYTHDKITRVNCHIDLRVERGPGCYRRAERDSV